MTKFRVGIIGCGRPWGSQGATGMGQGNVHAEGYKASPDCELVAAADIARENLDLFCEAHGIANGYLDYRKMLEREALDIVSVCVWPKLHAPVVIEAARAGVRAIHCEKPMAPTWREAREMVAACEEHGVQLTFNHQRRFGKPFREAKRLLDSGAIGDLVRLEAFTSNLYDWGTHWFDMMFYYNDDQPAQWAIGQIDARGGHRIFDVFVEGQGLSYIQWGNGVHGLVATEGRGIVPAAGVSRGAQVGNRLIGTKGTIELWVEDGPVLRVQGPNTGGQWEAVEVGERDAYVETTVAAIVDLADALRQGREPELSARKALQATELIFATYESSRRRGRVDLPLAIDDSPLQAMLDAGLVSPLDEKPAPEGWVQGDVNANRIKVHYYRTGGDRPPFVLSHGFSDNGMCWIRAAKALEGSCDLIMPDARGHGLSSAPESGYDDVTRAADLARFVMALGLEKPAAMGHSMGAATTAMAAANYPTLFSCIVLEDPPWFDESSPWAQAEDLSPEEREKRAAQRLEQLVALGSKSIDEIAAIGRKQSPSWHETEFGPWASSKQQLSPNALNAGSRRRAHWTEVVPKIACPTLLLIGDPAQHAIVSPETAAKAAEMNPLIEVVQLQGAGHNIRRERFDGFVEAVSTFLARHYGRAPAK
jgi:UDP-N-acetylglucosamine 3-dehydrogenase